MERIAGLLLNQRVRAKLNTPKQRPPIGNGIAKQSCDTFFTCQRVGHKSLRGTERANHSQRTLIAMTKAQKLKEQLLIMALLTLMPNFLI